MTLFRQLGTSRSADCQFFWAWHMESWRSCLRVRDDFFSVILATAVFASSCSSSHRAFRLHSVLPLQIGVVALSLRIFVAFPLGSLERVVFASSSSSSLRVLGRRLRTFVIRSLNQ